MPDITMCMSRQCPSRGDCYRYLAPLNERQSYAEFEPRDCKDHMPVFGLVRSVIQVDEELDSSLPR